jgi:hypothetical protein
VTFHGGQPGASGLELPPVTNYQPGDRDGDGNDNRQENQE